MEIGFPKPPSMAELIGHVESTFQIENRLMRPPTNRQKLPFRLQHIQVFDAVLQRWVDLLSSTQLHPWTQLYVFQYSSPSKTERPAQLSATRPIRSVQANSAAEKLWLLFQDVDVNGNGYIERDELQRVFSALGLFAFSESQVDGVFASADTNRDGVLSYAEVSKFSGSHPHVIDTLLAASEEYLECVRLKDTEKAYVQLKYDEVEAQYQYLQQRRDVALMRNKVTTERDALIRAEAERMWTQRNVVLEDARREFLTRFGQDPASPAKAAN
eukprot:gene6820-10450_t